VTQTRKLRAGSIGYTFDMPIHDWTRVTAGTFHDFHGAWISELRRALNGGLLPSGYYALAEQVATHVVPDVLTLQELGGTGAAPSAGNGVSEDDEIGGVAVAKAPPRVAVSDTITEALLLAARRRRLVIRHTTGDRIVALLEIVSPGNKEKRAALNAFVEKAIGALDEGFHLLLIDLFPPGTFDSTGVHGALWERLGGSYNPPPGMPLTLASYVAAGAVTCYVEPTTVGSVLIPMPLFLNSGHYVNVPLEPTYTAAFEAGPQRWKRVLEGN
jgi:hypothetical protein